jgi:type IV pilus assembly protein PilW
MNKLRYSRAYQRGLGLPEILVGLAIGLVSTIIIVQVMSVFEGQKRTTGGNSDVQTNGGVGLSLLQRHLQAAGFGLPIYSSLNSALQCDPSPTFDDDGDPTTPAIGMFPVTIIDGGASGNSDTVIVRGGTSAMGGAPITISNVVSNVVSVTNNLGCANGDVALVSSVPNCTMKRVTTVNQTDTTQITMDNATGLTTGATLACMGNWTETTYTASGGNLLENGVAAVSGIVNIQAQYGVSSVANSNTIANWVDASSTSGFDAPSVATRNRIKAIRIAVVARSDLKDTKDVTSPCTDPVNANGPCAWTNSATDPAPLIDLSADPDWKKYRYRVFSTVVPLRNIIWSRALLQ